MKFEPAAARQHQGDLLRRSGRFPFLALYFAMPSYLRRQAALCCGYGLVCLTGLALSQQTGDAGTQAFALGIAFPGAGFLHWAGPSQSIVALFALSVALLLFALALLAWFATGNVLLLPLVWGGAAVSAANPAWFGLQADVVAPFWSVTLLLAAPFVGAMAIVVTQLRRRARTALLERVHHPSPAAPTEPRDEIALDDLKRLRVLLDRALQPVNRFDGFEWRDQFQTAAMRYQINFMSYALSMARANYLPAATAYMDEAQQRLIAKLGNEKVWGYWALENAWGNLRVGRDPVSRDNIMFTGFTGLQMALSKIRTALTLRDRGKAWRRYDLSRIADILAAQYQGTPSVLLACEPNWVYPLCNLITACGVKAADRADGSRRWDGIADQFRASLIREFTTSSGEFVPFRSSLTGIAPARLGGAVMRAFPCLFLNVLYPDLAEEHWERLRRRLIRQDWRRSFWPIDVGNYGFSRASSYAASAAAAIEIGDGETATALLARLEEECPSRTIGGVTHRERASLWAHDLELVARMGRKDGLRAMVADSSANGHAGPILINATYPDVLIARATSTGQSLELVLYPGGNATSVPVALAGLCPNREYRTGLVEAPFFKAGEAGQAQFSVRMHGRTALSVTPVS